MVGIGAVIRYRLVLLGWREALRAGKGGKKHINPATGRTYKKTRSGQERVVIKILSCGKTD